MTLVNLLCILPNDFQALKKQKQTHTKKKQKTAKQKTIHIRLKIYYAKKLLET